MDLRLLLDDFVFDNNEPSLFLGETPVSDAAGLDHDMAAATLAVSDALSVSSDSGVPTCMALPPIARAAAPASPPPRQQQQQPQQTPVVITGDAMLQRKRGMLFECLVCSMLFKTKKELKQHDVTHQQAKPFECLTCGKAFKRAM
ncbi:hypothetical protein HDU77_011481, partial [Chytriomyces hyalinus]